MEREERGQRVNRINLPHTPQHAHNLQGHTRMDLQRGVLLPLAKTALSARGHLRVIFRLLSADLEK